jgi:hypothetical protein
LLIFAGTIGDQSWMRMIKSLKRYTKYFLHSAFSAGRIYILYDVKRYLLKKDVFSRDFEYSADNKMKALQKGINWLITAQEVNNDGGLGSFHMINKWSPSYPETTGYIIPTFIEFGREYQHQEPTDASIKAADFLLKIQKRGGGWQGGRVGENKPEIVFNTGQVIRGMIAAYEHTGRNIYLDSAIRAGKWLSEIQHEEGFWKNHALMNQERVYDTYVDAPLLNLYRISGIEQFRQTAIRNLDWVIHEKMMENGWFEDCDNTVKRNKKPILHTIAYTIDGLIDSGLMLKEDKYISAAVKSAVILRDQFLSRGFLYGRYDRHWNGSEYMICTGSAQMAIIWLKLYRITGDRAYLQAGRKMNDLMVFIQSRPFSESPSTNGAIPGSFPLWGRYEPFAYPNWATKFFCDALMLEMKILP